MTIFKENVELELSTDGHVVIHFDGFDIANTYDSGWCIYEHYNITNRKNSILDCWFIGEKKERDRKYGKKE